MARLQEPNPLRDRLYQESLVAPIFEGANFKAWINRRSLRYLENGELTVSFVVPLEAVEQAKSLTALLTNPMPLEIIVRVDQSFLDQKAEDEARLRAL